MRSDVIDHLQELDSQWMERDIVPVEALVEAALVLRFGPLLWLAPYHVVRWPIPSMVV